MSEPPDYLQKESSGSELPPPTRAGDTAPEQASRPASGPASNGTPARAGAGRRRLALIAGGVLALVIVIVILVLSLGGGDGTKATANPLEVRQLVATFDCTATNPGTPSGLKVTAGQEVVLLGRGGCAVVGSVIDKVDRATKVTTGKSGGGCTVTFQSAPKYGAIVDKASVVTNGYARALVAGGYVLDLRASLYPPDKPEKLSVIFSANDQSACDKVANALRRT